VTFDLDANGILNVTAHDKATGREQKITITASSGLSQQEIDRMVRDAEAHAQEDRQRKEEIEVRNRADGVAYQAEKTLRDVGDKVSAGVRSEVEERVKAVRDALSNNENDRLRSLTDDLESAMQRIGQDVYSQNGATAGVGSQDQGPTSESDSGTVEGEYREV
jgi:molecular chaperone DnaK